MSDDAIKQRPGFQDIAAAAQRIKGLVELTPVVRNDSMDEALGCRAWFKCENLQTTGAFKLRGASNAVQRLREQGIGTDVATHSSGNHGAALAYAARADGRKAHVVMPENAVQPKIDAVRKYGGAVIFCKPTQDAREAGLAALVEQGLIAIPPYDHFDIIAGQGTAALEMLQQQAQLDFLLAPVGGGGLISGTAIVARHVQPALRVIGVEPAGAADTFESLRRGMRVDSWQPDTIADGLRALVGTLTFPVIRDLVSDVLTVSESGIRNAVGLAWDTLGMIVEPSAATVIAALQEHPGVFSGKRVGMILSGGNIDRSLFPELDLYNNA